MSAEMRAKINRFTELQKTIFALQTEIENLRRFKRKEKRELIIKRNQLIDEAVEYFADTFGVDWDDLKHLQVDAYVLLQLIANICGCPK